MSETAKQYRAYKPKDSNGYWYVDSGDSAMETVCYGQNAERNAKMFARAPTLLSQVEQLREACQAAKQQLGEIYDQLYGKNYSVNGFHLNGDTEPIDTFLDEAANNNAEELLKEALKETEPK